jgi:transcriptional regulator with PAS, ATPase and Fis domain
MATEPIDLIHGRAFAPVAVSRAMREILELIGRIAAAGSVPAVLLQGECGVGKSMLAALLHEQSLDRLGHFTSLRCDSLSETLLEGELFGYERPGNPGQGSILPGAFEVANQGTVFLDQIGELSGEMQERLLRLLDERQFRRIGGQTDIRCDVLLVAATEDDLAPLVRSGMFRADLYYWLGTIRIVVPPLRERAEDILPLAEFFLDQYAAKLHRPVPRLTSDAKAVLLGYHWPGNVRQLHHAMLCAMLVAGSEEIDVANLPPEIREDLGVM